ncbi:membrane protein [Microbacterium phage PineapplePluto]|nr:membrane protein [Microbacterium phage PineapplePluto]
MIIFLIVGTVLLWLLLSIIGGSLFEGFCMLLVLAFVFFAVSIPVRLSMVNWDWTYLWVDPK